MPTALRARRPLTGEGRFHQTEMGSSEPICQALNLSDGKSCTEAAVVWDNLFCRFHGQQCHGLYAGYKRRNNRLESLAEQAPGYLKSRTTPLANETFQSINDEDVLRQIHSHLFLEYVLLGKVIDARKLHHKHFYPRQMDYGHQAYLDSLASRRHIVLRALERLEKRTAQVLYEKEKWFNWVREVQLAEETTREKEAKKIKLEAAMFKRHWKKMEARLRNQRKKEETRRQDAFLEAAYQERMNASVAAATDAESDADAEMWDPIEDFVEDERARYVDLIKHFLWLEILSDEADDDPSSTGQPPLSTTGAANPTASETSQRQRPKSRPKAKTSSKSFIQPFKLAPSSDAASNAGRNGQTRIRDMIDNPETDKCIGGTAEPDTSNIETEAEMRKRLKEGVEKNYDNIRGPILIGSLEMPHGSHEKTAPMDDDEIERLIQDIKEIKLLLFCRLLLSHASLLPAALRATNVDEFLSDSDITETDLRDICLKVEKPSLQDIRDACADLMRGDEPEVEEVEEDPYLESSVEEIILQSRNYAHLEGPNIFINSMLARHTNGWDKSKPKKQEESNTRSDTKSDTKSDSKSAKMKVQICGKSIWNYSSESSMTRDGWLHFSVLAKDCDLNNAVELCRNWDEFSQLNFLASWQYFPASNWMSWGSDRFTKQLHDLGFFPFFTDLDAKNTSHHYQAGGARSQQRRQHHFVEARNLMVGHMKRKDPVTRRFLQYCSMRTGELLIAVIDRRNGKVLTAPKDQDALWTLRYKMGKGRAAKNEWETVLEVGHEYFLGVELYRNWHLGFDDYLEVWIWSFVPGEDGFMLYNVIVEELRKAWRIRKPIDVYNHQETFLRTLTRNRETLRVRSIKPGEQVSSLWDEVQHPDNIFYSSDLVKKQVLFVKGNATTKTSPYLFYSEANEAEDAILFPDELETPSRVVTFKEISNPITRLEMGAGTLIKYLANIAVNSFPGTKRTTPKGSDSDEDSWASDDSTDSLEVFIKGGPPRGVFGAAAFDDKDGTVTKHWRLPRLYEEVVKVIDQSRIDAEKTAMLRKVGLLDASTGQFRKSLSDAEFARSLKGMDRMMLMEKDRADAFLDSFHSGDLEPGAPEKYQETCSIINGILGMNGYDESKAWLWFCVEILAWLNVRADSSEYTQVLTAPWPHPFVTQDILKSWAYMAIFFPELEQCAPATSFFKSEEGQKYQNSALRTPLERSQVRPDIRTNTSYKYRPRSFWQDWENVLRDAQERNIAFVDALPMEWSIAMRPIVAKLYLAGIVSPMMIQNSPLVVPGIATAGTEPHRPGKLDLFIDYADREHVVDGSYTMQGMISPDKFPLLLPIAQRFAAENANARFALLRLWSAPHFYPAMLGNQNRVNTAFIDGAARSWRWNFIPKDMPLSEWSMYNNIHLRLEPLRHVFGDRVVHRSEVVLVMGVDQLDLFRYVTAVTFAVQTKPWFREFDLWKSFVNVGIEFLDGLDGYWLD
ncbi:hypothetical protein GGR50DRAFT_314561 [Xylaria sp. CBS 124048]|nr:hypothetical protein GGR50DRAFT_314561 [Xylaria sp. CBS 124048]